MQRHDDYHDHRRHAPAQMTKKKRERERRKNRMQSSYLLQIYAFNTRRAWTSVQPANDISDVACAFGRVNPFVPSRHGLSPNLSGYF